MTWFKENFPERKIRIRLIILLIILSLAIIFYLKIPQDRVMLKANNCLFKVDISNTPRQRYQGLSNRDYLCQDCGMLFLFDKKQKLNFVMREMNFPLDLIFIADRKILNIYHNLEPEGKNPQNIYSSSAKADAVLEINAHKSKECQLKPGDLITWSQ
jgi:uncharacterized protein